MNGISDLGKRWWEDCVHNRNKVSEVGRSDDRWAEGLCDPGHSPHGFQSTIIVRAGDRLWELAFCVGQALMGRSAGISMVTDVPRPGLLMTLKVACWP